MKKFVNTPDQLVPEALAGMARAHQDKLRVVHQDRLILRAKPKSPDKVAVISGGGAGHEPMHFGFVGHGMLDAACIGEVFSSPTPDKIVEATRLVNSEAGHLYIVKNYAGDVMNFEMASEMAPTGAKIVFSHDDISHAANGLSTDIEGRGVAGTLVVEKVAGAAAEQGRDLDSVADCARLASETTASMAVALSSCTVPATGQPSFEIADNEMEIGVGIHGERGQKRAELQSADEVVHLLLSNALTQLKPKRSDPLLLICNGLGATPLLELYVLFESSMKRLEKDGYTVARSLVGSYCTALDMAGASISLTCLRDDLLHLWDEPVNTVSLKW